MGSRGKRIVMLGAGKSQVPLMRRCKQLGWRLWAFDLDPNAQGAELADEFWNLSSEDASGIRARVSKLGKVDAVVTASAREGALTAWAQLAQDWSVPGPSPRALAGILDRRVTKQNLSSAGIATPQAIAVTGAAEAPQLGALIAKPVVVKPAGCSSGSSGVTIVREAQSAEGPSAALLTAQSEAAAFSPDGTVLIEEFNSGPEYSVNAVTGEAGQVHWTVATRKLHVQIGARRLPAGHRLSEEDPDDERFAAIEVLAGKVASSLELTHTAFNFDLIWTEEGPRVIDVGMLFDAKVDRLLHHAGTDVYGALLSVAAGEKQHELGPMRSSRLRFLYADGGLPMSRGERERLSSFAERTGSQLEWNVAEDDEVRLPESLADVVGWTIEPTP